MFKKYIFILGCHKSGTSLLRSIFDNQKGIFTIPIETHPFKMLGYPINYPLRKNLEFALNDFKYFKKNVYDWMEKVNILETNKYGGSYGFNKFNLEIVKQELNKLEEPKDFIYLIRDYFSIIYNSTILKDMCDIIIEKSVENFEYADILDRVFENSYFIHIIRNPYNNLFSLINYHKKLRKKINYFNLVDAINFSFYYLTRNMNHVENYYFIKYEDLTSDPKSILKKLCRDIDIEYDNNMLNPTIDGMKWKGNSSNDKKFCGISESKDYKLSPYLIELVNRRLKIYLSNYNYKLRNCKKISYLKKMPDENLRLYILSRIKLLIDKLS
jgi:hypothetical protein